MPRLLRAVIGFLLLCAHVQGDVLVPGNNLYFGFPTKPLVEFYHPNVAGGDTIYVTPEQFSAVSGAGYFPTQVVSTVFDAPNDGRFLTLYRCFEKRPYFNANWDYSFYTVKKPGDSAPCVTGGVFGTGGIPGKWAAVGQVAIGYDNVKNDESMVALTRYRLEPPNAQLSLLSTVQNDDGYRQIMRYNAEGGDPLIGYVRRADYGLDGNMRWMLNQPQRLCYGVTTFTTNCPKTIFNLRWELIDPVTGKSVIPVRDYAGQGLATFTPGDLALAQAFGAKSNHPLLLTVRIRENNFLLAAKTVRLINSPWLAQFEDAVKRDDRNEPSDFPNSRSALLLANQMTAHTSFTHPMTARIVDPALYDGVISKKFFDPTFGQAPLIDLYNAGPAAIEARQVRSFTELDRQGVLVAAEAAYSFSGALYHFYPFDFTKMKVTNGADAPSLPGAEYLDVNTGQILPAKHQSYTGVGFLPDWSRPEVVAAFTDGARTYLERLYRLGISLSHFAFSEIAFQGRDISLGNQTRLPYWESPTFSRAALQSFQAWSAARKHPITGFPVYKDHYDRLVRRGMPPEQLSRLARVDYNDDLWRRWSFWRRQVFNNVVGQIAAKLKEVHDAQAYTRSPLNIVVYDYYGWAAINGRRISVDKIRPQDRQANVDPYLPNGYDLVDFPSIAAGRVADGQPLDADVYLAARQLPPQFFETTIRIDPGFDFYEAVAASRNSIDAAVLEVKYTTDDIVHLEAGRLDSLLPSLRALSPSIRLPRLGFHVDTYYPTPGQNFMSSHLAEIFANGYKNPKYFLWSFEAKCPFVMTMKEPDVNSAGKGGTALEQVFFNHTVDGNGNPVVTLAGRGSYAALLDRYTNVADDLCLGSYLGNSLRGVTETSYDVRSQRMMRDNMQRLIGGRWGYLSNQ